MVFMLLALATATATFIVPEAVALLGLAVFYLNVPGIAVTVHGVPAFVAGASFFLLLGPLAVRLLRREQLVLDRPSLLLFAFLGSVLLSMFVVQDLPLATAWITTFLLEGVLMYLVALNLFRTPARLRRALIVLVICGAVMGTLTIYQEATHDYKQQFAGLARRNLTREVVHLQAQKKDPFRPAAQIRVANRAGGPLREPNRYAQILLVLVPIAYFLARGQRVLWIRALLLACGGLTLAGVLLTYSRGAFVALIFLTGLLVVIRAVRIRTLALFMAGLVAVVAVSAPGYLLRVATLQEAPGLLEGTRESRSESVMRSRLTEMLAAWTAFVDHPILGVGPGQFGPVYSEQYMANPDIAFKTMDQPRRAHTLYFELAAETGILGLGFFLGMVGLIQLRLWRAWRRWRQEREDLAGLAVGFFAAIWGYLISAVFLHLSYQRYYWLLLGIAAAALQILREDEHRARTLPEVEAHRKPEPLAVAEAGRTL